MCMLHVYIIDALYILSLSHPHAIVYSEKCEKWRKLPANVAPEDLPDVWYCSMNTWDVSLANCDAPEEAGADDDAEC